MFNITVEKTSDSIFAFFALIARGKGLS